MDLTILLDIEAVLDTRYGRLISLDESLKDEILFKFDEYCSRDHDNMWLLFPQVDKEVYLNTVVNEDILKLSLRTNIFNVIDDIIRSSEATYNEKANIVIQLATRDFNLSPRAIEAFLVLISARYEHQYKVEHTKLTSKELTPKYLKEKVDIFILYDFNAWLEFHSNDLTKVNLSNTVFYIPTLFIDKEEAERNFYGHLNEAKIDGAPLELISDFIWDNYQLIVYFIANRYFSPISLAK